MSEYEISINKNEHSITSKNILCCADTGRVIAVFYNDYDLENFIENTRTQSQWISEELAPALNKCFKCKIGCDGVLIVAVDDYNELVEVVNKAAAKVGE